MSSRRLKWVGTLVLGLAAAGAQAAILPPPGPGTEGFGGAITAPGRFGVQDAGARFDLSRLGGKEFARPLPDARLFDLTHDLLRDLALFRPGHIGHHDGHHGRPHPHHRVAEPATWATLAVALAALTLVRRRPARAAAAR